MKRFYLNIELIPDQIVDISNEIVRHMHVVRIKIGELIEIFDGNNNSYKCEILSIGKREATLKVIQKNPILPPPSVKISLALGLIANDKMDLIIQKAVELGVTNIIPLISEYSGRLINERSSNKLTHWQNIIINSCCQCGQNILPTIALPIPIESLYEQTGYDVKVIMNVPEMNSRLPHACVRGNDMVMPSSDQSFMSSSGLSRGSTSISSAILLVGPEGGFTDMESKEAAVHGYQSLQLGNLIMRAETAAIAGISVLNLYLRAWIPAYAGMT